MLMMSKATSLALIIATVPRAGGLAGTSRVHRYWRGHRGRGDQRFTSSTSVRSPGQKGYCHRLRGPRMTVLTSRRQRSAGDVRSEPGCADPRKGRAVFEVARRTMYLIGRENRTRWIGLALLSAFTSAVEMLGALLVYALVALVADPQGQIDIPVVGDIRRLFEGTDEVTMLLTIVVIMGVFFLFRAGVVILVNYLQLRLGFNTGATLASQLAAGYLALPYAFHLHRHSSELIHNTNAR